MGAQEWCETHKYHDLHMCKLRKKGLNEEISRRSDRSTVACEKCGAKANEKRDLCRPRPL